MRIEPDGKVGQSTLTPAEWHTLELDWNGAKQECRVSLDGRIVETLPMQRQTTGVNYIRFRLTGDVTDEAGLLIESVDAFVSE